MESLTRFLREKLKLRVNPKKSAVDRPWSRKFLGFSMSAHRECRGRVAPQAVERFKDAMREKFREGRGHNLRAFLESLKPKLRGWGSYFSVAEARNVFEDLDQWLRSRYWRRSTGYDAARAAAFMNRRDTEPYVRWCGRTVRF